MLWTRQYLPPLILVSELQVHQQETVQLLAPVADAAVVLAAAEAAEAAPEEDVDKKQEGMLYGL